MLLLKDNKMINESLNNKYYAMNALEVITYHPIIFARVFTQAIQRSMPLDSKDAEKKEIKWVSSIMTIKMN